MADTNSIERKIKDNDKSATHIHTRNTPANERQIDAFRRAAELYKDHKEAIDKLAEL